MKVVVHQGFHKTGTRTLQTMLLRNRSRLKSRVNILVPSDLKEAGFSARRFSVVQEERVLNKFRKLLRQALARFENEADKPLLVSSEEFAGLIPGRKNVYSYSMAPFLSEVLLNEIEKFADGKARVTFFFPPGMLLIGLKAFIGKTYARTELRKTYRNTQACFSKVQILLV